MEEVNDEKLEVDFKEKREHFNDVSGKELKDGFDHSSFDNVPFTFHNLQTSTFGLSSNKQKNPFFEIKKIAMNSLNSWEDRTLAVRYMDKIPHIHRVPNCIEAAISIVSDQQYNFEDRYRFFANNEKLVKLSYEITNACHRYVYDNFDSLSDHKLPLVYKILSAQYYLTQFPPDTYDVEGVQKFLLDIARDNSMEINYRAETADILDRTGYGKYKQLGKEVINELGNLYNKNQYKTIYTNAQNVHDTTITKKVIDTLRYLMNTITTNTNSGDIYTRIIELIKEDERKDSIIDSFQRILIDTSKYEGLNLIDILLLVWEKIYSSDNILELEKRLLDELHEMDKTCSSGHLSRIINVLSGFFDDIQPVKISFTDQLKTNVFARYTAAMRSLGEHEQEAILQEMTSDTKYTIEDFIFSYSPIDELRNEFVPEYLTLEEFELCFRNAEKTFFGYKD